MLIAHKVIDALLGSEAYKGTVGWWISIIPRFLVGHAELDELSHEYRVQASHEKESSCVVS